MATKKKSATATRRAKRDEATRKTKTYQRSLAAKKKRARTTITGRTVKDEKPPLQNVPAPKRPAFVGKSKRALEHIKLVAAAREALPRIQSGETSMNAERIRLGLKSNGPWHKAIKEVLGGEVAYKEMVTTVRPARHVREARHRGAVAAHRVDDTGVPVIFETRYDKGWSSTTLTADGHRHNVIVSPEGTRYVNAHNGEKADLIVDCSESRFPELGRIRLKLLEKSQLKAAVQQEDERAKEKATKKKAAKKKAVAKKKAAKKKTARRKTTKQKIVKRKTVKRRRS